MRVLQHNGPVVVSRRRRDLVVVNKSSAFIVNNVKIIAFTGIIPESEIEYKIILVFSYCARMLAEILVFNMYKAFMLIIWISRELLVSRSGKRIALNS